MFEGNVCPQWQTIERTKKRSDEKDLTKRNDGPSSRPKRIIIEMRQLLMNQLYKWSWTMEHIFSVFIICELKTLHSWYMKMVDCQMVAVVTVHTIGFASFPRSYVDTNVTYRWIWSTAAAAVSMSVPINSRSANIIEARDTGKRGPRHKKKTIDTW